jgi:hypothetical protein
MIGEGGAGGIEKSKIAFCQVKGMLDLDQVEDGRRTNCDVIASLSSFQISKVLTIFC